MSLLTDLKAIDLSGIVNARASISVAVSGPDLKALLDLKPGQAALGDLGAALAALQSAYQNPQSLLGPLADALGAVAGTLKVDPGEITTLLGHVKQGAALVEQLFKALHGDAVESGKLLGFAPGQVFDHAQSLVGGFTEMVLPDVTRFRQLVDRLEKNLPRDPLSLADAAIEVLLPLSKAQLSALRGGVDRIFSAGAALKLPRERIAGLTVTLDRVTVAARTGDLAALRAALDELGRVRLHTVAVLGDELRAVVSRVNALQVGAVIEPMLAAGRVLGRAETGILEFLNTLREVLAQAREMLAEADPAEAGRQVQAMLDFVEQFAQTEIVDPVDEQVERLKEFVRGLFRAIPLRALQEKLRAQLREAVAAIERADLGRYAREVRGRLDPIRQAVESADLAEGLRTRLQQAAQKIRSALDAVDAAITTIRNQIEAVAAQALGVLERGAQALETFKGAIDQARQAIEQLPLEASVAQVVDQLAELRQMASDLLAKQPLPDALRPLVEQLIQQLESGEDDLVKSIQSLTKKATADFNLGAISGPIKEALETVRQALDSLVPAQLVESIQQEIGAALEVLKAFDPAVLLGHVTHSLRETVDHLTALNPQHLAEELRKPFQALLDGVDALHPDRLLKPVYDAFDQVTGGLNGAKPDEAAAKLDAAIGNVGGTLREATLAPAGQALGGGAQLATAGSQAVGKGKIRPGDVIRMLGWLPAKLHEALKQLEVSAGGAAVQALHAVGGGLVEDLRRAPGFLWDLETQLRDELDALLRPLAAAHLRAELAVQAGFNEGPVSVSVELDGLFEASPPWLRDALAEPLELACGQLRQLAGAIAGQAAAGLDEAARRLGDSDGVRATGSLEGLLQALDMEPLAQDFEAFVIEMLDRGAEVLPTMDAMLREMAARIEDILRRYNPAAQAMKFLSVLDVLREEFNVLNPRRLGADLAAVHGAVRQTLAAFDPALLAADLGAVLQAIGDKLKALDPAALLGDLSFLNDLKTRIEAVTPAKAFEGVGTGLKDVGTKLTALDPSALLGTVEDLPKRLEKALEEAARRIVEEIQALLKSLQFASTSASASAEVSL